MLLALEANQWVAIVLGSLCLVALAIIVVAPWRKVRAEHRLPDEVESRLLLGDDPKEIAEGEDHTDPSEGSASPRAEILDLDPERRSSA
ncbi:MAG: hypothetical protein M3046_02690 [Actinomycetota bacterium]|nr:hypothetical protein [Actinomycetota bacterium]